MRNGGSCAEIVRSILLVHCDGSRGTAPDINVFLDFENASPSESEEPLFLLSDKLIEQADILLGDLKHYGAGASAEVRRAIEWPDDDGAQTCALELLDKLVLRMRNYYDLSQRIEQIIPAMLWELCSGPLPPAEQLEASQATCRQFARIIDFVLSFDAVKMCTPALQNDFSFYRRVLFKQANRRYGFSHELTGRMSLFLASPTPMLFSLTTATRMFVSTHSDLPVTNTTDTLATIALVCRFMVEKIEHWERLSENIRLFTIRVMVGAIILYDHVDSSGAFCKESPIDLRSAVELIKSQTQNDQTEALLNALRYTTKHLNDGNTPKSVRALFP